MAKRVLVTGAGGFIGGFIVAEALRGADTKPGRRCVPPLRGNSCKMSASGLSNLIIPTAMPCAVK